MIPDPDNQTRRISVDLPENLIIKFDELKKEWGLRGRGAVLKRLLEVILPEDDSDVTLDFSCTDLNKNEPTQTQLDIPQSAYDETKALVLIGPEKTECVGDRLNKSKTTCEADIKRKNDTSRGEINLPGFVINKSEKLRQSLAKNKDINKIETDPVVSIVKESDIQTSLDAALAHWISLYSNPPGDNVVEAAMIWLARDIWNNLDSTEGTPFTWSTANKFMIEYCPYWRLNVPSLERILVLAGVLEDPFATNSLPQRMPTLIRRFVNKYRRSKNLTSFETIESTMTVHGALKLLGMPTLAGAALTLNKIREGYKAKALLAHPDSGGSTESMRRINEAYQLLKELYRNKP